MPSKSVSTGTIQSVERALNILKLFKDNEELGITQIASLLNLPKGTVHGLVKTLEKNGFVEQNEGNLKYHCGMESFKLGMISAMRMDLRRLASQRAQKLTDELEETVHLAVLMNGMCVIIDRFSPSKPFLLIPQVGSAVPAHCTATGKVLLSQMNDTQLKAVVERCKLDSYTKHTVTNLEELRQQLEEVRLKGYAISDQEALLGLTCIAAPVKDYTGSVTASLSVAGSSESFMEKGRKETVIAAVVEAAKDISSCLGYEF